MKFTVHRSNGEGTTEVEADRFSRENIAGTEGDWIFADIHGSVVARFDADAVEGVTEEVAVTAEAAAADAPTETTTQEVTPGDPIPMPRDGVPAVQPIPASADVALPAETPVVADAPSTDVVTGVTSTPLSAETDSDVVQAGDAGTAPVAEPGTEASPGY